MFGLSVPIIHFVVSRVLLLVCTGSTFLGDCQTVLVAQVFGKQLVFLSFVQGCNGQGGTRSFSLSWSASIM